MSNGIKNGSGLFNIIQIITPIILLLITLFFVLWGNKLQNEIRLERRAELDKEKNAIMQITKDSYYSYSDGKVLQIKLDEVYKKVEVIEKKQDRLLEIIRLENQ